jgi:hypothetical protein
MAKKKVRDCFQKQERNKLIELVKGINEGAFLDSLLKRDMSTNQQKHKVWLKVTSEFCKKIKRNITVKQVQRLWYRILADCRKGRDKSLIEFEKSCKATGGGAGMSPPDGMFPIY